MLHNEMGVGVYRSAQISVTKVPGPMILPFTRAKFPGE